MVRSVFTSPDSANEIKRFHTPGRERRAVLLIAVEGWEVWELARRIGVSEKTVKRWIAAAANSDGPKPGRPTKLTPRQRQAVNRWLQRSPRDYGIASDQWQAPALAALIRKRFGVGFNHRYLSTWIAREKTTGNP